MHQTRPTPTIARDPLLWLAICLFGALLCGLSVLRYIGFNVDMFDLGNMAQAIGSVRRGEPLVFTFSEGPMSRLALHVELFYFVLALPYALWPDPRLLVAAQAALYALGALPAYALGMRRLESRPAALAAALLYLLYPVAQTAVLLDIHGDTLAMPFLLFAIDALDRRAWRSYALWIALALSCKFYVAAPVLLLAPVIWWCYGERRVALLTALAGLAYGLLAFFVIRPLFTTAETSSLHRGANYISFYFGQVALLAETAGWRLANAVVVFAPILLPLRRGWLWTLPGLPIIAAALVSTLGGSASYASHHYAIAVPFLVMAGIDGLDRLRRGLGALDHNPGPAAPPPPRPERARLLRFELAATVGLAALLNVALVDTPLSPIFWSGQPNKGLDQAQYGITSRDPVKAAFLQQVPSGAPLAVSLYMAPHVVDRDTLYMVRYEINQSNRPFAEIRSAVEYAVADALFDFRVVVSERVFDGGAASEVEQIGELLQDPAFGLVAARDGLLLFRRDPPPGAALAQSAEAVSDDGRPAIADFGGIELLSASVEPLGGRRFRATFDWRGNTPPPAVAVSRLEGLPDARIVHLPTYALLPTGGWPAGYVVRERFEIELPADVAPGAYPWRLGWYDLGHSEAYMTDARSRLGEEYEVATIEVRN